MLSVVLVVAFAVNETGNAQNCRSLNSRQSAGVDVVSVFVDNQKNGAVHADQAFSIDVVAAQIDNSAERLQLFQFVFVIAFSANENFPCGTFHNHQDFSFYACNLIAGKRVAVLVFFDQFQLVDGSVVQFHKLIEEIRFSKGEHNSRCIVIGAVVEFLEVH